jgi:outer membrane lipoprotein-sorting protein
MKKILFCLATSLMMMAAAWSQTPEEIISLMEKALEPAETRGMTMVMDFKIPIIGTSTTTLYTLGNKTRSETTLMGHHLVTFSDGITDWEYDSINNELTIENAEPEENSESELFDGITDDYTVSLKKETAEAWYLLCKKSKLNHDKDAPDKMELVVSKKTHMPISLSTKMKGIKLTLRDMQLGVDPAKVSFRMEDYPNAKIIDKRNS